MLDVREIHYQGQPFGIVQQLEPHPHSMVVAENAGPGSYWWRRWAAVAPEHAVQFELVKGGRVADLYVGGECVESVERLERIEDLTERFRQLSVELQAGGSARHEIAWALTVRAAVFWLYCSPRATAADVGGRMGEMVRRSLLDRFLAEMQQERGTGGRA